MRRLLSLLALAMLLAPGCGEEPTGGDGGGDDLAKVGGDAKPAAGDGGDAGGMGGGDGAADATMGGGDGATDLAIMMALDSVAPAAASRAQATPLTLTGAGFQMGATVTLESCDGNMTKIDLGVAPVSMNGGVATVNLPADAMRAQGYYSVTITNPDGTTATPPCALLVSALPPPT